MRLDRNITEPKRGKYALIKLRDANLMPTKTTYQPDGSLKADAYEVDARHIDFGDTDDTDFFVIRLKDKYAAEALYAYAEAARLDDLEYADEIFALGHKAEAHPNKQRPT